MIYFMILTALTVSIDSFFCGFSLSLSSSKKLTVVIGVTLTVLAMCLITNYATMFFADKLTEKTANLAGIILIGVGVFNLFKPSGKNSKKQRGIIAQSLISGFAVGTDGATANLSLALMGLNAFYVPLTIAFFHALMISLSLFLSSISIVKKLAKIEFLPPLILILLGGYKLLGFFI
ncbi:MAG: manganese efflux pump [Clostridia bacterium]|nr:manganese efflux pump [Clostridia bacterium]